MFRAAIRIALVSWLAVAAMFGHVRAQGADDLSALNTQVIQLHREGKHAEAVPVAQRALALAERLHGADHADVVFAHSQPRPALSGAETVRRRPPAL